jgi:hypothetical protein
MKIGKGGKKRRRILQNSLTWQNQNLAKRRKLIACLETSTGIKKGRNQSSFYAKKS